MKTYNEKIEELNRERLYINVGIRTKKEDERYFKLVGQIEQLNYERQEAISEIKELQIEIEQLPRRNDIQIGKTTDTIEIIEKKAVKDYLKQKWNITEGDINDKRRCDYE